MSEKEYNVSIRNKKPDVFFMKLSKCFSNNYLYMCKSIARESNHISFCTNYINKSALLRCSL